MSACYCTGACRRLGYCPNQCGHGYGYLYQRPTTAPDPSITQDIIIYQRISPEDMNTIADLVVEKLKGQK